MRKYRIGYAITLLLYVIFMIIFVSACSLYYINKSQVGRIDDETSFDSTSFELKTKKK